MLQNGDVPGFVIFVCNYGNQLSVTRCDTMAYGKNESDKLLPFHCIRCIHCGVWARPANAYKNEPKMAIWSRARPLTPRVTVRDITKTNECKTLSSSSSPAGLRPYDSLPGVDETTVGVPYCVSPPLSAPLPQQRYFDCVCVCVFVSLFICLCFN